MDEWLSIGDVARRTGLSVSAIRFYADEGIVAPAGYSGAGYRCYDARGVAALELVRTLWDLGVDHLRPWRPRLPEDPTGTPPSRPVPPPPGVPPASGAAQAGCPSPSTTAAASPAAPM
ncbi:MerR family transcriptional regulator [Micromonospora sp. NPDC002575]|uniref:helix-turn-helix domain-containing protein n=1 Tax=Micromonospora sp. NPDC002575 TaxID=3364222 RepID=UPI0036BF8BA7